MVAFGAAKGDGFGMNGSSVGTDYEGFGGHWLSSACLNGLLLLLFETGVNVSIIAACIDSQCLADFSNGSVFV